MSVMNDAYITATGAFLPGDPVDNEQLAARFGADTRQSAALRTRTLAANGIRTRHYAVDGAGKTLMLNEELAAEAAAGVHACYRDDPG
jgi:3-oxoacyl-[acyl-carrier-protein] synthase-3